MNEEQWVTSTDPTPMLKFLRASGKASARKLRLYGVACCRRIWPLLTDERSRAAVEMMEWYADGELDEKDIRQVQADILRDLFGPRPFPEVRLRPSCLTWNSGTVVRLATAIYQNRLLPEGTLDRTRLVVLADALEEADWADAGIFAHLRGPGPCVRGCWVVDLLTNKV